MTRFLTLTALLLVLGFPAGRVVAQTDDDRGYLQAFLEDNLSDAGREVRVTGFKGALSRRATIERLTIADDTGIWLTLHKVVLDWDRGALLKGHLSITELSASEILLPRGPIVGERGVPSPEASGFSLPELPVSVTIGAIKAGRVVLGQALIGEEAVIALQGSANLEGGAGKTQLSVTRIDNARGALRFAASYSNVTRYLDLALEHSEASNGIAANLIGVPGRPSVDLEITGAGPLEDFAADIKLATDGRQRLAGQVSLAGTAEGAEQALGVQTFKADIGGDIAPVFAPRYRAFFGPDIRLKLSGARFDDGRVRLDNLALTTQALQLTGQLELAAGGWPRKFALSGRIADATGAPVLLPMPGPETRIKSGRLALNYDQAVGDTWQGEIALVRPERSTGSMDELRLTGAGTLVRGDDPAIGQVLGKAAYAAVGIVPADPALAQAIGREVSGGLNFNWTEGAPLALSSLIVSGADYGLTGAAWIKGLSDGLNLLVDGTVALKADRLERFSGLAGLPLSGAAVLSATGTVMPLAGVFDLAVEGKGDDLAIGQAQLDPLLTGESQLEVIAKRDETGTRITRFDITTEHFSARTSGTLATGGSVLETEAQIADTARLSAGLQGPATLTGALRQNDTDWVAEVKATGPGKSTANATAVLTVDDGSLARIAGQVQAQAQSLTPFAGLAGQRISGAIGVSMEGWVDPRDNAFNARLEATGQSLGLGNPMIDPLLRGESVISATLQRAVGQPVMVDRLELSTPQGEARVNGSASDTSAALRFDASLRDIAVIAPGVSGPAKAEGRAELVGGSWQIAATGTGPSGTVARVSGQVATDAGRANLALSGNAPLGLANSFLSPNLLSGPAAYDLTLDGPFALASLSGLIRAEAARLVVPEQRLTLAPFRATANLSGGRATVEASAPVSSGGQVRLSGPVALTAPYDADLILQMTAVGVSDAALYDTSVDGRVALRGPLVSGASISADLTLGATEIQVAESGTQTAPVLAGLGHINEPAVVRQTRQRAGPMGTGGQGSGARAAYPIDILLRAPSRIFVRGRGLDAELGGQLRLTGTTADVVPQGQFDLIRGRLDILGKRLTLSEGFARLQGGFDPYIYLVAQTNAADTEIRIIVEGLASAPEITFSSTPDMPEDEVLARLLFGRDLTRISPVQAVQLAAAVQTLAGSGSGVLNRLRQRFGLDDLDITTDEEGTTGARVGKYVTENIYTDVTVGSDGKSEINLNITVSPSLTARGSVTSEGDSSLGLFFERDY